jgi:hypothetical protein
MAERRRNRWKRPAVQVAAANRSHCAAEVRAEETADQTAETRRAQSFCLAVFSAFFVSLRFGRRSGFGCGLAALRCIADLQCGRALDSYGRVEPACAPQNPILRYSRVQLCATELQPLRECVYAMRHLALLAPFWPFMQAQG